MTRKFKKILFLDKKIPDSLMTRLPGRILKSKRRDSNTRPLRPELTTG